MNSYPNFKQLMQQYDLLSPNQHKDPNIYYGSHPMQVNNVANELGNFSSKSLPYQSARTQRKSSSSGLRPRSVKSKYSRLGCRQCKERKLKCDESLPICNNCHHRSVSGYLKTMKRGDQKCSYLNFDQNDIERFKAAKDRTEDKHLKYNGSLSKVLTTKSDESLSRNLMKRSKKLNLIRINGSEFSNETSSFNIPKIKHNWNLKHLPSQSVPFLDESIDSFEIRISVTNHITDIFMKGIMENYSGYYGSIGCAAKWVELQLYKKYQSMDSIEMEFLRFLASKYYQKSISYLLEQIQSLLNQKTTANIHAQLITSTYTLQVYQLMSYPTTSSEIKISKNIECLKEEKPKFLHIQGAFAIITEYISQVTKDPKVVLTPIMQSWLEVNSQLTKMLYIPCYPHDVLHEFLEVITEVYNLWKLERDPSTNFELRDLLSLKQFLNDVVLTLFNNENFKENKDYILSHSVAELFHLQSRWFQMISGSFFTKVQMNDSFQKIVTLIYHTVAQVLEAIFPQARYLTRFSFIGPVMMYPFSMADIREGLEGELKGIANYFLRVLEFFTIRMNLLLGDKIIKVKFPESLNIGKNRFKSRRIKVKEVPVGRFKTTFIREYHYPKKFPDLQPIMIPNQSFKEHPRSPPDEDGQSGFFTDFQHIFKQSLTFSTELQLDPKSTEQNFIPLSPPISTFSSDEKYETSQELNFDSINLKNMDSAFLLHDYSPKHIQSFSFLHHFEGKESIISDMTMLVLHFQDLQLVMKELLK